MQKKVKRQAMLALAQLRLKAPYHVSFRAEPASAIADQSKPIRLVADFFAVKGTRRRINRDDLAPVVRWLDKEAPLKPVRRRGMQSNPRFALDQDAKLFAGGPNLEGRPKPIVLQLFPTKDAPAIATFKLMVLNRSQVDDARKYLIDQLLDARDNNTFLVLEQIQNALKARRTQNRTMRSGRE
jgi:hypothetical protein